MIVLMEQSIIIFALLLLGLCLGSFSGAMVWRLRARQLEDDKKFGDSYSKSEYAQLTKLNGKKISQDRSMCLHCHYTLKWYDLLPLFSWLSLGGKCRKCKKPIGYMEPLIELGLALFFVVSYVCWPYDLSNTFNLIRLVIWLISGVMLAILFAYDAKWFLLPNNITFSFIGMGILNSIIVYAGSPDKMNTLISIAFSVLILCGLYLAIYIVSNGRWIGFGDVKLGLGLSLMLADWSLAFMALFAANLIGCIIVLPAMLMKKMSRKSKVPFGPLLIAGYVLTGLFGSYLVNNYLLITF